ncbi:MAG TPA: methyltransferase domain-containing protein [Roseiflexaceae bacterium]|nr:methyltransferase domain-containing protein [Roseiflexaceae bacterium]
MAINETALNQLLERALVDIGATYHTALAVIGDKLGLYKTLAGSEPLTPAEFAAQTGTAERYIREWLNANAAGGYVTYHADTGRYSLSPEQALVLADESSPAFFLGGFQAALAATKIEPKIAEAFRTGAGVGWHEHDHQLFHGIERFFRTGYAANLVQSWIPALDGVEAKLRAGAAVADIGCGHGASTILMAQAFPNSSFTGFDYHADSIVAARQRAEAAGIADRVRFEVATAMDYPGTNYDLVTVFDALHDMGNPAGAASHVYTTLKADGTWLIVEPFAEDRVEQNLHPLGRAFYASSTMICTPNALDQDAGAALGAQAGEARLREVVTKGGFTRFRRAVQSPVNLVLEARP